jgi:hypothetical protein
LSEETDKVDGAGTIRKVQFERDVKPILPQDPDLETPAGVPQSHEDYVDLMCELVALAFQTDSTRIASLVLGIEGVDQFGDSTRKLDDV